jgi:hypothetical protein
MTNDWYVPLLIANAPIDYKYSKPIGQIDKSYFVRCYGLKKLFVEGIGTSLFSSSKESFVINSHSTIVGDTLKLTEEELRIQKLKWEVSNSIIKNNYFESHSLK